DDGNVNNYVDVQAGQPVSERQVLAETIDSIVIVLLGATYHFPQTDSEDISCQIVDMVFDLPITKLRALSSDSSLIVQHIEAGLERLKITPPSVIEERERQRERESASRARLQPERYSLTDSGSMVSAECDPLPHLHIDTPSTPVTPKTKADGAFSLFEGQSVCVSRGDAQYTLVQLML
ncbi:hypothetical protein KIPB_013045, partial [Kipferlia bialata]